MQPELLDTGHLQRNIEALLFVASEALSIKELAKLTGAEQSEVEVHGAGSIERPARSRAGAAQGVFSEQRCIEVFQTVARVVIQIEFAGRVVGQVEAVVVDAVGNAALERVVAVLGECYRETGACASNACEGEACR